MTTVWVVTYDWGSYGTGIKGIFSTREKAEACIEKMKGTYGGYAIEEVALDEEM